MSARLPPQPKADRWTGKSGASPARSRHCDRGCPSQRVIARPLARAGKARGEGSEVRRPPSDPSNSNPRGKGSWMSISKSCRARARRPCSCLAACRRAVGRRRRAANAGRRPSPPRRTPRANSPTASASPNTPRPISEDGRYVAFQSTAQNLGEAGPPGAPRASSRTSNRGGRTREPRRRAGGGPAGAPGTTTLQMSGDGRRRLRLAATNLGTPLPEEEAGEAHVTDAAGLEHRRTGERRPPARIAGAGDRRPELRRRQRSPSPPVGRPR